MANPFLRIRPAVYMILVGVVLAGLSVSTIALANRETAPSGATLQPNCIDLTNGDSELKDMM